MSVRECNLGYCGIFCGHLHTDLLDILHRKFRTEDLGRWARRFARYGVVSDGASRYKKGADCGDVPHRPNALIERRRDAAWIPFEKVDTVELSITGIPRKHMSAVAPLIDRLVVDVHIGLRQKRRETVHNTQLSGRFLCVLRASRAPQIKLGSGVMEFTNTSDDGWHRNPLCPYGSDERVIHVHEYHALSHVRPNVCGKRTSQRSWHMSA